MQNKNIFRMDRDRVVTWTRDRLLIGYNCIMCCSSYTNTSPSGPCYYVGSTQGGRTTEREENDSVIEGHYTDYQVSDLFDDNFVYSQFEEERCTEAA